jgi:hypothetical protein
MNITAAVQAAASLKRRRFTVFSLSNDVGVEEGLEPDPSDYEVV